MFTLLMSIIKNSAKHNFLMIQSSLFKLHHVVVWLSIILSKAKNVNTIFKNRIDVENNVVIAVYKRFFTHMMFKKWSVQNIFFENIITEYLAV